MSKKVFLIITLIIYSSYASMGISTAIGASWTTEVVDTSSYITSGGGIALDSMGNPHIAYGKGYLYYAYYNGNIWHYEIIDSSQEQVSCVSIALNSSDHVYISYYDSINKTFKYATNASGEWVIETVTGRPYHSIWGTSMNLDSSENVHISYYQAGGGLRYATNASGSWVKKTVDSRYEGPNSTSSIAVDSVGNVHISYFDNGESDFLRYATNASGSWVIETVDIAGYLGKYPSIALDSSGNVHISYYGSPGLKYATNASGSWVTEIVDSSGNVGAFTSIAVDFMNNVHISYYDATNNDLKYATNASGSWVTEIVDSKGGRYTSIALDSSGNVHISYSDSSGLKYATNASGSWVIKIVDSGSGKWNTSIAVDSSGKVHISYYTNGFIKYATNVSGAFIINTIDKTRGDRNKKHHTSIAVDSKGNVHISYRYMIVKCYGPYPYRICSFWDNLKYATNSSGTWVTETVDDGGNIRYDRGGPGSYSSIAIDSAGNAHISYFYSINKYDLKYATNASGSWVIETVDSDVSIDTGTSIALDSSNRLHISYRNKNDNSLKYAYRLSLLSNPDISVTHSIFPIHDLQMPFGNLTEGLSLERVVKIINDGNANLEIYTIAQNDPLDLPFSILNDNCSNQSLAPSESCTFTIKFTPTTGAFSDTFDIPSNDPDEDPVTITVSGTGLSSATNNPPSVPQLVYPANSQKGLGTTVEFKWKKSTDPDLDTLTYHLYYSEDPYFIDTTPIQVASLGNKGIYYASIGLLLFGIALVGGVRSRRKIVFLSVVIMITAMLLVSCGGGGNGDGESPPASTPTPSDELTYVVTGLKPGTTYYWKVIVDDGNGGVVESDTYSFTTGQ